MGLVCLKCFNCGSTLEIDETSLGKYMFCNSCGSKFIYERDVTVISSSPSDKELLKRGVEHLKTRNIALAKKAFDELIDLYPENYKGYLGVYLVWLYEHYKKIPYMLIYLLYGNGKSKGEIPKEYRWLSYKYYFFAYNASLLYDSDKDSWGNLENTADYYYHEYEHTYLSYLNKAISKAPPKIQDQLLLYSLPNIGRTVRDHDYEKCLSDRVIYYKKLMTDNYCVKEYLRESNLDSDVHKEFVINSKKQIKANKSASKKTTVKNFFSSLIIACTVGLPLGGILSLIMGGKLFGHELQFAYFFIFSACIIFTTAYTYKEIRNTYKQKVKDAVNDYEEKRHDQDSFEAERKGKIEDLSAELKKIPAEVKKLEKEISISQKKKEPEILLSLITLLEN